LSRLSDDRTNKAKLWHSMYWGLDLRIQVNAIQSTIGVCPQDDLLWDTLTGREKHLNFYERLKNLRGANLSQVIQILVQIKTDYFDLSGAKVEYYFCLSVSLFVVLHYPYLLFFFLFFPSLLSKQQNRVEIKHVTTYVFALISAHSMEEAEHLCDPIGILFDGSFQCLGSPDEVVLMLLLVFLRILTSKVPNSKAIISIHSLSPNAKQT
ncbi:unnamed protein product, partial [Coffea canephora]